MGGRVAVLARLARAVRAVGGAPVAEVAAPPVIAPADRDGLLALFRERAGRVGLGVVRVTDLGAAAEAVLAIARCRGARRVATWGREALGPVAEVAEALRAAGLEVGEGSPDRPGDADRAAARAVVAAADLGLTAADLAVAESGSLVLAAGPGRGRGVSLLPPCHVAVLGLDRLVGTLEEALAVVAGWQAAGQAGSAVVFVTGPSRTADIELSLTRGVHGPAEVHAVFVDTL